MKSKMKTSRVLLLASAFALLVLITPSEGGAKSLKTWLDDPGSKGFLLSVTSSVGAAYNIKSISTSDPTLRGLIQEVTQTGKITAAMTKARNAMYAYSGKAPYEMSKTLQSPTNFLPWDEDRATFLLLDSKWDFYVTSQLSGCDVWIADHEKFEPLTLHINANDLKDQPVKNLEYKEKLAVAALKYFNENVMKNKNNYYKFVMRMSYDYKNKPFPAIVKQEIDEYWNGFHERFPDLPSSGKQLYEVGKPALFYGAFTGGSRPSWDFSLKDNLDGTNLKEIDCPVNAKRAHCTIV